MELKKVIGVILFALLMGIVSGFHPYYVSVFFFNQKPNTNYGEILIKVYTNDLEDAIKTFTSKKVLLNTTGENKTQTDSLLQAYCQKHIHLKAKNKELKMNWVGFEYEKDVTWLYLESDKPIKNTYVEFYTSFLTGVFEDQKNMVHVNWGAKKDSYILDKETLSFNVYLE